MVAYWVPHGIIGRAEEPEFGIINQENLPQTPKTRTGPGKKTAKYILG